MKCENLIETEDFDLQYKKYLTLSFEINNNNNNNNNKTTTTMTTTKTTKLNEKISKYRQNNFYYGSIFEMCSYKRIRNGFLFRFKNGPWLKKKVEKKHKKRKKESTEEFLH